MPSIRKELRNLATQAFDDLKAELKAHVTDPQPWEYDPGIVERYEAKQERKRLKRLERRREINEAYAHTHRGSQRPRGIGLSNIISQPSKDDRHDVLPLKPEETKQPNAKQKIGLTIKPKDTVYKAEEYRALIGEPSLSNYSDENLSTSDDELDDHMVERQYGPQVQKPQYLGEWEAVETEAFPAKEGYVEELDSQQRVGQRQRIEAWLEAVEERF